MEGRSEAAREQREEARAKLGSVIKAKLLEGTYDELRNAHVDALVIDDGKGHHSEHEISRDEAEAVEQAVWSAGEDQTVEFIVRRILGELDALGFDFHVSEPPDVSLAVRRLA